MRMIQLPDGSLVDPDAIRMIEARTLRTPWTDAAGKEWPAAVTLETHRQLLRIPCASAAEATQLRDMIGACVNARGKQRRRAAEANGNGPDTAHDTAHDSGHDNGQSNGLHGELAHEPV
jgi:hypothetical protein